MNNVHERAIDVQGICDPDQRPNAHTEDRQKQTFDARITDMIRRAGEALKHDREDLAAEYVEKT